MSKIIKVSTGLTGLQVAKNPYHTLKVLYGKTQRALAKMPQEAAYRKYTEQIISDRLKKVETIKEIPALENAINCGQVEELIVQAENELILARKMLGWKPWEQLAMAIPNKQWDWPPAQITEQS